MLPAEHADRLIPAKPFKPAQLIGAWPPWCEASGLIDPPC